MTTVGYQEVEHTADWAIRVRAPGLSELFRQAALGMFALMGAEPADGSIKWRRVDLAADDLETLLVDWLQDLLFAQEMRNRMPDQIEIDVDGSARLRGRVRERPSGRPDKPIKAVTYHLMVIEQTDNGLETLVVFDV
jgi:SHS2 domain-containing protein